LKLPQPLSANPVKNQNPNTYAPFAVINVYVQVPSEYICGNIQEKHPIDVHFPIVVVMVKKRVLV
jgi:hypothetical protein